jgi:hypothetical protein
MRARTSWRWGWLDVHNIRLPMLFVAPAASSERDVEVKDELHVPSLPPPFHSWLLWRRFRRQRGRPCLRARRRSRCRSEWARTVRGRRTVGRA